MLPHILRSRRCVALLALGLLCTAGPLQAAATPDGYNQVSLSSEVRQELPLDRMQVVLYTEAEGRDPAQLASQISEKLNKALQQARGKAGVQVRTGNRQSYPLHDNDGRRITGWRERAEIQLSSADFPALSQLTGELLENLQFGSLNFSLSAEQRSKAEDQLMSQLVERFGERASLVSRSLGASGYRLVRLDIDSAGNESQPMIRGLAMKAMAAPVTPEVEAGTTELVLRATGVIEVQKP